MTSAPIILVPGFWLGAWAWDEVAESLTAEGHHVTSITLPGLESVDADRSAVTVVDHVDKICEVVKAVAESAGPVVLAVHSASGYSGYAASDRLPDRIAAMVYVDSAPGKGAMDADFADAELPLPTWEKLGENLDGLSEAQLETFRTRSVPVPGGVLRDEPAPLADERRLDIPSTVICTGYPSSDVRASADSGDTWCAGLRELRDVTYADVPTSHWPMWSRPKEIAELIGDAARRASGGAVTGR